MYRTDALQSIIDKLNAKKYLEIGVFTGGNFLPIKAPCKIAVDPDFQISYLSKLTSGLKQGFRYKCTYIEKPSDKFFAEDARQLSPFDVVFIDGLHTHKQSLQDVLNTLDLLADNGVIMMHDCYPPNSAAAYPAESLSHAYALNLPGWTNEWCGDTWKTICTLRSTRPDLQVFVMNSDYGLGVITKGASEKMLDLTAQQIEELTYEDLAADPTGLLNLKDPSCWQGFLASLKP